MALDKLVDSTALDGALTATANAIRAKTGSQESIAFNSSTGFSVAIGDIVFQHYYTGNSEPSSSLGDNGDIYLKT